MESPNDVPKADDVRLDANEVHIGAPRLLRHFEERHALSIVRAPSGFDKRSIGRLWVKFAVADGYRPVWITGEPLRQLEVSVLSEPERYLSLLDTHTRRELSSVLSAGAASRDKAVNPMSPHMTPGKYSSSVSAISPSHSPLASDEGKPRLFSIDTEGPAVSDSSPWLEDMRLDELLGEVEILNSPTGRSNYRDESEIVAELLDYLERVRAYVENLPSEFNESSLPSAEFGVLDTHDGARVPRPDESLSVELSASIQALSALVRGSNTRLALVLEGVMDANPRSQVFTKFVWSLFECIPGVRVLVMNSEFTNSEALLPSLVRSLVLTPEELRVNSQEIMLDAQRRGMELTEQEAEEVRRLSMGWPVHARIILTHAFRDVSGTLLLDRGIPSSLHFFQDSLFTSPVDFEKVFIFIMAPFEAFTVSDAVAMFTKIQPYFPVIIENVLGRPLFLVEEDKCRELMSEAEIRSLFLSVASFGFIVPRSISAASVEYTHGQLARFAVDAFTTYMERPLRERLAGYAVERLISEGRLIEAISVVVRGSAWGELEQIVKHHWGQLLEMKTSLLRPLLSEVPKNVLYRDARLAVLSGVLVDTKPSRGSTSDGYLSEILGLDQDFEDLDEPDALFDLEEGAYQELPTVLAQWGFSRFLLSDLYEAQISFDLGLEVAQTVTFRRDEATRRLEVYKAAHLVLLGYCNRVDPYLMSVHAAVGSADYALAEIGESVLAWMATSRMEDCNCGGQSPVSLIPGRANSPIAGIRMAAHNYCAIEAGREVEALLRLDRQINKLRGTAGYTLVRQLLMDAKVHLLMALGRLNQAEDAINEADGSDLLNLEARTRLLYLRGEFAEAIALSVSGLEIGSDNPRIRQALLTIRAGAELALGNRAGARENTRHAYQLARAHGLVLYFGLVPHDTYVELTELVPELGALVGNKVEGHRFPFVSAGANQELTARERQVVRAMGREQSIEIVAANLGITRSTVESYLAELMEKFDVEDFTELEDKAREQGYLD